jgi:hypothetical protein
VRTLGLRPLRADTLAGDRREVRVWTGGRTGLSAADAPAADEWRQHAGQLFHYWRMDSDTTEPDSTSYQALIRRSMNGPLVVTEVGESMEAFRFTAEPDWRAVLAEAEAAGMWTLPD